MRVGAMRKLLVGTAALVALVSPAISADMQALTYAAPPAAAAEWNWTGCYVGGQAGGLWATEDWINQTPGGDFNGESLGGHDLSSGVGGMQTGCDFQFPGGLVIGIQADYAWADAEGSHDSTREFGVDYGSGVNSLASVTGRIGYARDRFLGYIKSGGAWEGNDYWASTIVLGTVYTSRDTRSGWTVGAGGEYAFTKFLSGFVEVDYYDFGNARISFTPQISGLRPAFVDIRETTGVLHVGLNLRFGG
jgi:outer membrane immunogenic protein